MKKMSCRELGGACDETFIANNFEEIAELSKEHAVKMFQKKDAAHIKAAEEMKKIIKDPEAIKRWYEEKANLFNKKPNHA